MFITISDADKIPLADITFLVIENNFYPQLILWLKNTFYITYSKSSDYFVHTICKQTEAKAQKYKHNKDAISDFCITCKQCLHMEQNTKQS